MTSSVRPPFDTIRRPEGDPEFLHLCWMLHNQCNHRCSYCAEVNWGGSHRWLKLDAAVAFVERALAHYPNRKMMVSFTGGEPTLWPDFDEFVEWLASRGVLIGMTTNGTKPLAFFEKYSRFFDWMSFSFHPEFTRPEKFLENVAEASKHSHITLRAMMPSDPKLWEKSKSLIEMAQRWNIEKKFESDVGCDLVPIASGFGTTFTRPSEYSIEQSLMFAAPPIELNANRNVPSTKNPLHRFGFSKRESPHVLTPFDATRLLAKNETNFQGWTCDVGLEQLFIDEKGMVERAGCRVGGQIGHIFDRDLKFPTTPVRCVKTYCHCNTDILTSKRSPEWELETTKLRPSAADNFKFRVERFRHDVSSNLDGWRNGAKPSIQNVPVFATVYTLVALQFLFRHLGITFVPRKLYYFARFQFYKRVLRRPWTGG